MKREKKMRQGKANDAQAANDSRRAVNEMELFEAMECRDDLVRSSTWSNQELESWRRYLVRVKVHCERMAIPLPTRFGIFKEWLKLRECNPGTLDDRGIGLSSGEERAVFSEVSAANRSLTDAERAPRDPSALASAELEHVSGIRLRVQLLAPVGRDPGQKLSSDELDEAMEELALTVYSDGFKYTMLDAVDRKVSVKVS